MNSATAPERRPDLDGRTAPPILRLGNVSDYLGAPERRFFGEGYKRAQQRLTGVAAHTAPGGPATGEGAPVVTATAAVDYPADWSRKGTVDQKPHLSTIDVLLLGVRLTEELLGHHRGLTGAELRDSWIRRARIKAGAVPVEDGLSGFPVSARLGAETASPDPGRTVSVVDATVGALTVRVELDHPDVHRGARAGTAGADSGPEPGTAPGQPLRRPFGDGCKKRRQSIEDVVVGAGRDTATAVVRLDAWDEASGPGEGTEGGHQPSAGLIDAFVVALQLGQIMLYELDQVDRADSHTLWMRSTLFEASTPHRPLATPEGGPLPVTAELRNATVLRNRSGETWRRADIVAELSGVGVVCSVAHRLPG
ncbi:AvrD family protein [Streptomyces sp. WMMC940]|uniref:AvrD family protein n=1 Tax=Streptomyces sp. WMMC940 TaxID=3015153 RepID=UPI0022B67848|nr:AvrD family protein [Streptomyces sp. WMMC940]MCZ7459564.1 AvrD family protein [Streptomyces sp. WMMC940]